MALLAALAVTACDGKEPAKSPPPQEVSSSSIAEFCGMSLQEHVGPKAQIFVKSRADPYWFSSVHDMFAFTMLAGEPRDIIAIYVNDMGVAHHWDHPEAGTWIDAYKAVYVIGSRRSGGMDEQEAVPFGDEAAAEAFIARYGGRLVRFSTMPRSYVLPGESGESSADGHQPRSEES
jgi:copper chaperone NosL